jgi:hypothetical protein
VSVWTNKLDTTPSHVGTAVLVSRDTAIDDGW